MSSTFGHSMTYCDILGGAIGAMWQRCCRGRPQSAGKPSAPAERGQSHQVWRNHYTIDRNTANGIEPSLRWMRETEFPVVGVMFYFHTLYYGRHELFLTAEERAPIIKQLLGCIRAGLPVINSRAGLLAVSPAIGRDAYLRPRSRMATGNMCAAARPTTYARIAVTPPAQRSQSFSICAHARCSACRGTGE